MNPTAIATRRGAEGGVGDPFLWEATADFSRYPADRSAIRGVLRFVART
jgi:hypothetical protein